MIKIIEITNPDGSTTEHVIIDNGDNSFTSMSKAHYDEQIKAQEKK